MTRPTDAAIAYAFINNALDYQQLERDGEAVPPALEFIDEVTREAEQFDAESPAGPAPYMHIIAGKVPTPDEPAYDHCPKCTAHMPPGATCGGPSCGLRK